MKIKNIRNFVIISHVDHGKSTLADRMLELTGTIEKRKMRDQILDNMELERERGITIKMQPVRMEYTKDGEMYILNLIDTPGHIDFSYEVSRALKAVEGALLLIDVTQGVQAQTLSTLETAKAQGLTIVPVLSKIDSPLARASEIRKQVQNLLGVSEDTILECSGKTGEGVSALLDAIVEIMPAPVEKKGGHTRSLIFDFKYSSHRGIVMYVRIFEGELRKGDDLRLHAANKTFKALEVGIFSPNEVPKSIIGPGEIGYVVTGIKEAGIASVGDTLLYDKDEAEALQGYMKPYSVVWASIYPESQDDFLELRQALERLQLSDSSLTFEEESSGVLGRGFRCGFLGMLHLEIISERLRREFDIDMIVTTPSITYEINHTSGEKEIIHTPIHFPQNEKDVAIREPWISMRIITPPKYIGPLTQLLYEHEAIIGESETFGGLSADKAGGRVLYHADMPLRELMRNFFSRLKNATSGFASLSYDIIDNRDADVVRLDVLVAEEPVPAFSRIVSKRRVQEEAQQVVERLYKILPRQQFVTKIQAVAMGRILSSKKLSALKKDVTGHLYGGDITRKRKLWEKQKKGKKRALAHAKVNIPHAVYIQMMQVE